MVDWKPGWGRYMEVETGSWAGLGWVGQVEGRIWRGAATTSLQGNGGAGGWIEHDKEFGATNTYFRWLWARNLYLTSGGVKREKGEEL